MSEWIGYGELAAQAAGGVCIRLLDRCLAEWGASLKDVTLFLADLGPGSFTGVRVGVTLAKTLAYARGAMASGADAFDLIDPAGTVVLPSRRGEWFIRVPGETPCRSQELPTQFEGYGGGIAEPTYPTASAFRLIRDVLKSEAAEKLVPKYLIEPSISLPKTPYGANVAQ